LNHEIWLWLWFQCGMAVYMLKRAYYLVTGPNPIANSYGQFFARCWIPLLVRAVIDSGIFWLMFTPGIIDKALAYFGWTNWATVAHMVTQFAPMALFFGMGVDSIVDFAVSKVPFLKDWLPQMPGPLPPAAPAQPPPGGAK
jgi:hypothetical protein